MCSALRQSCPLHQREKGYAGSLRVYCLVPRQPEGAGTGAHREEPGLGWFLDMALPELAQSQPEGHGDLVLTRFHVWFLCWTEATAGNVMTWAQWRSVLCWTPGLTKTPCSPNPAIAHFSATCTLAALARLCSSCHLLSRHTPGPKSGAPWEDPGSVLGSLNTERMIPATFKDPDVRKRE